MWLTSAIWVNLIQSAENIKSKTEVLWKEKQPYLWTDSVSAQDFLACQPTLDIC